MGPARERRTWIAGEPKPTEKTAARKTATRTRLEMFLMMGILSISVYHLLLILFRLFKLRHIIDEIYFKNRAKRESQNAPGRGRGADLTFAENLLK